MVPTPASTLEGQAQVCVNQVQFQYKSFHLGLSSSVDLL